MMESAFDLLARDDLAQHDLRVAAISREQHKDERRYTTGLKNVDEAANLMQPGGLVVIGAREGQGKTALAERIALDNSWHHRVLFVSLDMPAKTIQDRVLSKTLLVGIDHVNFLSESHAPEFARAMEKLEKQDIMVWAPRKGKKSIHHIIERAEQVTAAIVIIDYCRLLDGWDYGRKAADIVDILTDWSHDSMITAILLTQLRDDAVNRRPHNGFIQDTTQIAQRADRVMLIYRPYAGRPAKDAIAEITTTKNRWGPPVLNHAGWTGETMDLFPLDAEEEANAHCCRHKT